MTKQFSITQESPNNFKLSIQDGVFGRFIDNLNRDDIIELKEVLENTILQLTD